MKYLILFLVLFATTALAQFSGGSGTIADPYQIASGADLNSIRGTYLHGQAFIQTADIDLSSFANWNPIGNNSHADSSFIGIYDGNGFTIKNLTITSVTEYSNRFHVGLFGEALASAITGIDSTIFKNITLDSISITGNYAPNSGDLAYIGSLVGEFSSSTSANFPCIIDSTTITNTSIKTTGARSNFIGGLVGAYTANADYGRVFLCFVEGDSLTQSTNSSQQHRVGGLIGTQSGLFVTVNECGTSNLYIFHNRLGNYGGGLIAELTGGTVSDCYAWDIEAIDNLTTIAGFAQTGTLIGANVSRGVNNSYAVGTTTYNAALGFKTGFYGGSNGSGSANFFDLTIAGTSDTNVDSTGGSFIVYPRPTDSMKTQGTFEWRGWDFDTTWTISAGANDGYPALGGVFYVGYILGYPSASGELFLGDSLITIFWNTDVPDSTEGGTDTTLVYYKYDDGIGYIFIDSVFNNDTTLAWTIPQVVAPNAKVFVFNIDSTYADSSDFTFAIVPIPGSYSQVDIFDVQIVPYITGDTLDIYIETVFVDSLDLFWSFDSVAWFYIDNVQVDTLNGFLQDTTIYEWITPLTAFGEIAIKAIEGRDTTKYFTEQSTLGYVGNIYHGLFCANDSGGTLIASYMMYDPSCGWNSNITQRYYKTAARESLLGDVSLGYSTSYNVCEACCRQETCSCAGQCVFPTGTNLMIRSGGDSLLVTEGTIDGTILLYKNRRYYLDTLTYVIKVTDLINNITQTLVDFSSAVGTGSLQLGEGLLAQRMNYFEIPVATWLAKPDTFETWSGANYAVMNNDTLAYDDTLHLRLIDSLGVNFGDFNEGYILVGDAVPGKGNVYYASLLGEPAWSLVNAEDIYPITGVGKRDFFRGIHPKIWKWGIE